MRDSERFDRYTKHPFPTGHFLSGDPRTYKNLRIVWATALILLLVAALVASASGAFGFGPIPADGQTTGNFLSIPKFIVPAISAVDQKNTWAPGDLTPIALQELLVFGWIVTIVSYLAFWRIMARSNRQVWIKFRNKLQHFAQRDTMYVAIILFVPVVLCVVYFDFIIAFRAKASLLPMVISLSFYFLIYLGQIGLLMLFARIWGNEKT